ncbi:MAG: hypothetical protein PHV13_01650 [Candidatus ainarchaeum sp.]|nr:hypothetical protein [Candidatus ainarchaeum sp.]
MQIRSAMHAKGGQGRNDARLAAAREKLLPLVSAANKQHVDRYLALFIEASTPGEFRGAMARQGGYGAGYHQLVGQIMIALYGQDEAVRRFISARVGELGIAADATDLYFRKYIATGLNVAIFKDLRDLIPENKRKEFTGLTDQLMLDVLKRHIGLETKQE